jgi:hypothetical protein
MKLTTTKKKNTLVLLGLVKDPFVLIWLAFRFSSICRSKRGYHDSFVCLFWLFL